MRKFTIIITDEAMEQIRQLLARQTGADVDPECPMSNAEAIKELFFVDDRGFEDLDVRSEVTVTEK